MININDDIMLIGTTELRTEIPKLAKNLKIKTVIITKRGKPVAVLEDYSKYKEKEGVLDDLEDMFLGHLAMERWNKSKKSDYVPLESLLKKYKIKL